MNMYSRLVVFGLILAGTTAWAQQPQPAQPMPPMQPQQMARPGAPQPQPMPPQMQPQQMARPGAPQPQPPRPAMDRLRAGPPGRWWNNPQFAEKLGLTADQQKKMDDSFQQHRLKLIDLNAALQKEEVILEPMVEADQPDESRIVAQIDRVAQARAELEKANARMLLGIRRVLTQDQWKKLQAETAKPRMMQALPPTANPPGPAPTPRRER